jgi:hypothetical protein
MSSKSSLRQESQLFSTAAFLLSIQSIPLCVWAAGYKIIVMALSISISPAKSQTHSKIIRVVNQCGLFPRLRLPDGQFSICPAQCITGYGEDKGKGPSGPSMASARCAHDPANVGAFFSATSTTGKCHIRDLRACVNLSRHVCSEIKPESIGNFQSGKRARTEIVSLLLGILCSCG